MALDQDLADELQPPRSLRKQVAGMRRNFDSSLSRQQAPDHLSRLQVEQVAEAEFARDRQ